MVAASSEMTKSNALKLEYRVKHVSANKKIFELTKGEETVMAMNMKKELQSVRKSIDTLSKKLENELKLLNPSKVPGCIEAFKNMKKKYFEFENMKKMFEKSRKELVFQQI